MKLRQVKKIWHQLNEAIFEPMGQTLPAANHRLTRSNDLWAYWLDSENCYYWNYKLEQIGDLREIYSLVFHEMVHHWGDLHSRKHYAIMQTGDESHDALFYWWQEIADKHRMKI